MTVAAPYLSVVIPLYNEENNLGPLMERLIEALDSVGRPFEIIFINDGSQDHSLAILKEFYQRYPQQVRIIDFQSNFGQHMAIIAGFEHSRGEIVITLDADLQNPPEEIPKLIEQVQAGYDYVGSKRRLSQDSFFRRSCSYVVNRLREKITNIQLKDHGCMLRAYHQNVVKQIVAVRDPAAFIPALAWQFSLNPTELEVAHEARAHGKSKYNLYRLIRLHFDLVTGFSLFPLQLFTIFGMAVSFASAILVLYIMVRRFILGPEAEGVFTLIAILIFLTSIAITGIGLIGEYIGRMSQSINQRPRFVIRQIIEGPSLAKPSTTRKKSSLQGAS